LRQGAGSVEDAVLKGRRYLGAGRRRQFLLVVLNQGEDVEAGKFFAAVEEG
jgi:hypothetical protein